MSRAVDPRSVAARWVDALSRHDLETAAACFAEDYEDEAPARPGETVHGASEVRANFARLFRDVPDLRAEIRSSVVDEDAIWMEWRMFGTRVDGTFMEFVGVNIFRVQNGRFTTGRIYTELVRNAGSAADQLDRITKGGS